MNRYELLKNLYSKSRVAGSMNFRDKIPQSMNIFDIDFLIESGHIDFNSVDNTIGLTLKGVILVESTQVNAFGRIDVANVLGYLETPDGGYVVSDTNIKYH